MLASCVRVCFRKDTVNRQLVKAHTLQSVCSRILNTAEKLSELVPVALQQSSQEAAKYEFAVEVLQGIAEELHQEVKLVLEGKEFIDDEI